MPLVADWSVATRWTVAVAGVVVFVATAAAMARLGRVMEAHGGYGIVAFETESDAARSRAILAAWGAEGRAAARTSLWVDFAFVVAYVAVPLVVAGTSEAVFRDRGSKAWTYAAVLSGLAFLAAGFLDVVENVLLLRALGSGALASWLPPLVSLVAWLKFRLILVGLLVLPTVGVAAIAA